VQGRRPCFFIFIFIFIFAFALAFVLPPLFSRLPPCGRGGASV